jgi:hypothetical protein
MASPTSPLMDHVSPILAGDPVLSDENRADLFDIFHASKDPNELSQHLQSLATPADPAQQPLAVPDDTKKRLLDAKQKSMPVAGPVDKVTAAMTHLSQMDPKVLDMAESHPNVLKVLTAAATTPEKEPTAAAGGASAAPKGKKAQGDQTSPALAMPPRPDGLEHMPPIPEGHKRVQASDGGIHDIPADDEHLQKAFSVDPRLHVMNP